MKRRVEIPVNNSIQMLYYFKIIIFRTGIDCVYDHRLDRAERPEASI